MHDRFAHQQLLRCNLSRSLARRTLTFARQPSGSGNSGQVADSNSSSSHAEGPVLLVRMADAADFAVEPPHHQKFRVSRVREIIAAVLKQRLTGAVYHADNTSSWAREIADDIKRRLKEEDWPRYKYAVQVFIGEQRGEGVRLGCRGFWDPRTDNYAHDTFQNESLFCVAAAYGVYLY